MQGGGKMKRNSVSKEVTFQSKMNQKPKRDTDNRNGLEETI